MEFGSQAGEAVESNSSHPATIQPHGSALMSESSRRPRPAYFAEGEDTDSHRFRGPRMKPGRQVKAFAFFRDQQ